jgi:ligand-binding SRPBCC domain-containing protein
MKVVIETSLAAPIEVIWAALQTPRLLLHVCSPLMVFRPIGMKIFPDTFDEGRIRVSMWLFGVLPFGRQWLDVSRPPAYGDTRFIRDNGSGDLIRRWDHIIAVRPMDEDSVIYRDEVELDAGLLTLPVFAFAAIFYRWRQHRWRRLVRRRFRYD